MTNETDLNKTVQQLITIRKLWAKHFPFSRSTISCDILLAVLNAKMNRKCLYVKSLFANISNSDMGIRYHFDRLLEDGWIELENGFDDKRMKICKPSTKLENRFRALTNDMKKIGYEKR